MEAATVGPGQPRIGHDVQPPDRFRHGSSGIPRHQSSARGHGGDVQCTEALMKPWATLGSRPSFLLFLSSQLCRLRSTKSHPSLSSPKRTTIVFSSPLQPPSLWRWFLLTIGLMKVIITEVWMTDALATFHGVFVNSNPPSNAKMDSGGASSESSCLLDYSKKLLPPKLISQPHNHHPIPFTSQFWL